MVMIRKEAVCYGPRKIKYFYDIKATEGAIYKMI